MEILPVEPQLDVTQFAVDRLGNRKLDQPAGTIVVAGVKPDALVGVWINLAFPGDPVDQVVIIVGRRCDRDDRVLLVEQDVVDRGAAPMTVIVLLIEVEPDQRADEIAQRLKSRGVEHALVG